MSELFNPERKEAFLQEREALDTPTSRWGAGSRYQYQEYILPAERALGKDVDEIRFRSEYYEFFRHCDLTPSKMQTISVLIRNYLKWEVDKGYLSPGEAAFHPAFSGIGAYDIIDNVDLSVVEFVRDAHHLRSIMDSVCEKDLMYSNDSKVKSLLYLAYMGFSIKDICGLRRDEIDSPLGFIRGVEIPDEFYKTIVFYNGMTYERRISKTGREVDFFYHNDTFFMRTQHSTKELTPVSLGKSIIRFNTRLTEDYKEFPGMRWDLSIATLNKSKELLAMREYMLDNPLSTPSTAAKILKQKSNLKYGHSALYMAYGFWMKQYYPKEFKRMVDRQY